MSYTFIDTNICDDLIDHIFLFSKKKDNLQKSLTSSIIKSVFRTRTILKHTELNINNTLYGMLYSKLPFIWLLNTYDENDWEDLVSSQQKISQIIY